MKSVDYQIRQTKLVNMLTMSHLDVQQDSSSKKEIATDQLRKDFFEINFVPPGRMSAGVTRPFVEVEKWEIPIDTPKFQGKMITHQWEFQDPYL